MSYAKVVGSAVPQTKPSQLPNSAQPPQPININIEANKLDNMLEKMDGMLEVILSLLSKQNGSKT